MIWRKNAKFSFSELFKISVKSNEMFFRKIDKEMQRTRNQIIDLTKKNPYLFVSCLFLLLFLCFCSVHFDRNLSKLQRRRFILRLNSKSKTLNDLNHHLKTNSTYVLKSFEKVVDTLSKIGGRRFLLAFVEIFRESADFVVTIFSRWPSWKLGFRRRHVGFLSYSLRLHFYHFWNAVIWIFEKNRPLLPSIISVLR